MENEKEFQLQLAGTGDVEVVQIYIIYHIYISD